MRLIDADELLQTLAVTFDNFDPRWLRDRSIRDGLKIAKKAIEESQTVDAAELLRDQWISVEERLPETAEIVNKDSQDEFSLSNPVLTFGKNGFAIAMMEHDENHNIFVDLLGDIIKEVTHWMPLPVPPEEDKT